MKKAIDIAMLLMVMLVAGCSRETPTQAPLVNNDVIAELTAGAVGYESNGLAATIGDVSVAGRGEGVREAIARVSSGDVVVTESDSSFDPDTRMQTLSLLCERNRPDAFSEWQLRYSVHFDDHADRTGTSIPSRAESYTEGTYRNSLLTVQGSSKGSIRFDSISGGSRLYLGGEYAWGGTTILREKQDERYEDVSIRFSWNKLAVDPSLGDFKRGIIGRCDVNIRANGPNGSISTNGTLSFNGTDAATLSLGGKRYLIDIRTSAVQKEK